MKKVQKESFETIVHESFKEAGLIFPITDEEIEKFEKKFTRIPLPADLKDPAALLKRNKRRIASESQPVLQVAALFDSSDESTGSEKLTPKRKRKSVKKKKK